MNTMATGNRIRVERLANGYYRVTDYACLWVALYEKDGTHRGLGMDHPLYRAAVLAYVRAQA